ncbi:MAG: SDR family oxidoreductase [Anaerolineales bacterium]
MTRILITGASGLLGINLALEAGRRYAVAGVVHAQSLRHPDFETLQVDLLAPGAIARMLDMAKADWVINCAALANLDTCEQRPELAQRLNAELPGRLASESAKRGLRFLQVSTDAVFDGVKGDYDEEDAPAPVSVYGRTKRLAELAVKAAHPHALIVRPNFFGWSVSGNRSLAEFFYNQLSAGKSVSGFTDRTFCPLLVTDLAAILLELLEKNLRGIYHAVSPDHLSKYDFGVVIANRFGLDAGLIRPVTTSEMEVTAPRALDLTLRTARVAKALGRRPPTVVEGIERLFEQHRSGYRANLQALVAAPEPVKG